MWIVNYRVGIMIGAQPLALALALKLELVLIQIHTHTHTHTHTHKQTCKVCYAPISSLCSDMAITWLKRHRGGFYGRSPVVEWHLKKTHYEQSDSDSQ